MRFNIDLLTRCGPICPADYGYPDDVQGAFAPAYTILTGDVVFDCEVNADDLAVIIDNWLEEDYTVTPEEPDANFLLVEYLFASDSSDTSGNGLNGVDTNSPSYADGKVTLDGSNWIEIPFVDNPFGGEEGYTVAIDVNTLDAGMIFSSAREPNCGGDDPAGEPWDSGDPCSAPYLETHPMGMFTWDGEEYVVDRFYIGEAGSVGEAGVENTLVHTYDADSEEHVMYVNGEADWTFDGNPEVPEPNEDTVLIGSTVNCIYPAEEGIGNLVGTVDNVRVWGYGFSLEEALYYSGITESYPVPVDPDANFYATGDPDADDGDIINFLDEATFAPDWGKVKLFE
jgi:hypothetical protein